VDLSAYNPFILFTDNKEITTKYKKQSLAILEQAKSRENNAHRRIGINKFKVNTSTNMCRWRKNTAKSCMWKFTAQSPFGCGEKQNQIKKLTDRQFQGFALLTYKS